MNKLEPKHICGYLPFGLEVLRPDGKTILRVLGMVDNLYIFNEDGIEKYGAIRSESNKPLLYPLSHLTKEIRHKGEKFVPIERLFEIAYPANKSLKYVYDSHLTYTRCYHNRSIYHKVIWTNNELIGKNSFFDIQKLYEWHFAIDVPEHLYIDKSLKL